MTEEKEFIVFVQVKTSMEKRVFANSKKQAIERARQRSSPVDNVSLGEFCVDYLWSTATAEKADDQ